MWWLLVGLALAEVDAEDRWIGNENLAIGFDSDASLGKRQVFPGRGEPDEGHL